MMNSYPTSVLVAIRYNTKLVCAIVLIALSSLISLDISAQCSGTNTTQLPATTQTPSATPFASIAGDYFAVSVTAGKTYQISSSLATQQFVVREGTYNNATITAAGINPLTYVAQTTGTAYVHIFTNACSTSAISRNITFADVTCTPATLNIAQGFNSTSLPSCWYQSATVSSAGIGSYSAPAFTFVPTATSATATPQEGTDFVQFNSVAAVSGSSERLFTVANTSGVSSVDVNFYWGQDNNLSTNNDNVQVQYSLDGNTWVSAGSAIPRYSATAAATSAWVAEKVTLPVAAGNVSKVYIGFLFTSLYGDNCYLDNVNITPSPYTTAQNGDWNVGTTWNGGSVPPAGATCNVNHAVTLAAPLTNTGSITISSGASLATTAAITNSTGTMAVNGTLQLSSGGSIATTAPVYGSSSTLIYDKTGTVNPGTEWSSGSTMTAGAGVPQNVTIQNSTTLSMTAANHALAGNLNVTSGGLTLNTGSGDIYVGGNWSRSASTAFTPNSRAVFFGGASSHVLTVSGGETFNYLLLQGSGTLQLASAATVTASSGLSLSSTNATSTIDLNGQTLTLSGGGNLNLNTGTRIITSTAAGGIMKITTATTTVTSGGTLTFAATNTTLELANGFDCGSGNLTTVNGILQMDGGGFVSTNAPKYGNASTLVYNATYGVATEWTGNSTTAGIGVPQNVTIQNSASVTMPGGSGLSRGLAGNMNIASGTLTLGNNSTNDDLYVGGNWTRAATGTSFAPNGRAVFFTGSGVQTINTSASGGETFNYLLIQNSAAGTVTGSIKLASAITVNTSGGLTLNSSATNAIDLNGQTMTVSGGGTIGIASGNRTIGTTSSSGTFLVNGNNIAVATGGTLTFGTGTTLEIAKGFDCATGNLTTINGTLQIDNGGFINNNAPKYGSASTLKYYYGNTGVYGRGTEWNYAGVGTITTNAGYPNNVQISNNSTLDMGANSGTTTARAMNGNLTIDDGSTFSMAVTPMTTTVTVKGNVNIGSAATGTLTLSTSGGGDLIVLGNWNMNGTSTLTYNSGKVSFASTTAAQTITGATTFGTLVINNTYATTPTVTLSSTTSAVTVANTLTLTAGMLVLGANNLTLNSSTLGSNTAFIATTSTGSVIVNNIGTSAVTVPIGFGTTATTNYTPIIITGTSTTANYTCSVATPYAGTPFTSTGVVNLAWAVKASVAQTGVQIKFQWPTASNNGFSTATNADVVAYNGTTYGALYTPFTASGSPVTLTATGLAIPTTTNQFDIGNLSDIVCGTFTVSSGTPYSEPFDAGLTVPALPSCWLAFDVDADTHTWVTNTVNPSSTPNAIFCRYNGSAANNDWAITKGLNLTNGLTYVMTLQYAAYSSSYVENLEVKCGTTQAPAGMTTSVFSATSFNTTGYSTGTGTFTAPSSGIYYFGLHDYSITNQDGIYVDNFKVALPGAPTITGFTAAAPGTLVSGSNYQGYVGNTITVTGTNLLNITALTVNGVTVPLANITYGTGANITTQITFPAPDMSLGTGVISITTATGGPVTSAGTYKDLGYISTAATEWSTPATWLGGAVPPSGKTVTIAHAVTCTTAVVNTPALITINSTKSLTFNAGSLTTTSLTNNGTLQWSTTGNLTLSGGTLSNAGTLTCGSGTITVSSSGAALTGTAATLYNLTLNGLATLTSVPKITSTLLMNNGGSVSAAPIYLSGSTLQYYASVAQVRGTEWPIVTPGTGTNGTTAGYPYNVQISNSTPFNYPNCPSSGASTSYAANSIGGSLTVDNGSGFYMDYNSPTGTQGALTVAGSVILNGNLSLGNQSNGDLIIGGSWTRASTSAYNDHSKVVTFNGSGTQVVSYASGTQTFTYMTTAGSGTVQLSSSPATSVSVTGVSGLILGSSNATSNIDLNGQTLTVSGGGNLSVGGAARAITSGVATGTFAVNTSGLTVTNTSGGSLTFGNNTLVGLTTSMNFGSGLTTIGGGTSGTLQINGGGSVVTNGPKYAIKSLLQYNTGVTAFPAQQRGAEWTLNATGVNGTNAGYPYNVQISANTTFDYNNNTTYTANQIGGSLTVDNGSAFYMDYGSPASNGPLTVLGSVSFSGNISLGNIGTGTASTSGDLYVGGNWTIANTSTLNDHGRSVFFNAAGTSVGQTITSGTNLLTFSNLVINNTSSTPTVTLASPVAVSGTLSMTAGTLVTSTTNTLSVTNPVATAVTGGSTTSYVNGPLNWTLPANLTNSSTSFAFPVGNTSYLPFTLASAITTGSTGPVLQVQAFSADAAATPTIASNVSSISHTEYWKQTVVSGNYSGAALTLARQIAPSTITGAAQSSAQSGTYSSIAGTVSGTTSTTVSTTLTAAAISAASSEYYVMAVDVLPPTISGIAVSSPGTTISAGVSYQGYVGTTITVSGSGLSGITALSVGSITVPIGNISGNTGSTFTFPAPDMSLATGTVNISNALYGPISSTATYTDLGYISNNASAVEWSSGGTWLGGTVPPAGKTVTINTAVTCTTSVAAAPALVTINGSQSLTFNAGSLTTTSLTNNGTLSWGASNAGTLTISGGTLNNGGTLTCGNGTIAVSGSGATISGTAATLYNLTLNGAATLSAAPTISGTLLINTGGSVSASPYYASGSLLKYNTAVTTFPAQQRGPEWTLNATGTNPTTAGYPYSVQISGNTTLDYSNNASYSANQIGGSLTVDNGSAFYMDYGTPSANGPLKVLGSVSFSGNVSLGNSAGTNTATAGDLYVGGNWTIANTSSFNANSRAVFFNASGTSAGQTITSGTTLLTFPFLIINNTSTTPTVTLASPVSVSNTLTMTAGKLVLGGSNSLTISSTNAIAGPPSATAYIQTSGTGQLIQTVAGTQVLYPVGNTAYDPIWLTNGGASGTCGVICNTFGSSATGWSTLYNNQKAILRSWSVTPSSAANLGVRAQWNSTTEENATATFNSGTTAFVGMFNGTAWTEQAASRNSYTGINGSTPNITSSGNSSGTLTASSTYTFSVGMDDCFSQLPSTVVLSSANPSSTAGTIGSNTTNNVLSSFQLAISSANATLVGTSGLQISTSGTYVTADITNLKLWYQSAAIGSSFTGTGTLLSTITSPGTAGTLTFPAFTNQSIASGSTGYFFITADLPCGTSGHTITIAAPTTASFTFSITPISFTGTAYAGGTQTIGPGGPYTWIGTSGTSWSTASNWSPASVPCPGSAVIFNTAATIISVPTTVSLSSITVNTGGAIILRPLAGGATITLANSGTALSVATGTSLTLNPTSTSALTLNYASGNTNTANIFGTLSLTSGSSGVAKYDATNSATSISGILNINDATSAFTSSSANTTVAAGGAVNMKNAATIIPLATWINTGAGSTLTLAGSASSFTNLNQNFSNFTVNVSSSLGANINCNSALTSIAGALTITSVNAYNFVLATNTNASISIGSIAVNGDNLMLSNGTGTVTTTVSGAVSVGGGYLYVSNAGGSSTLNVSGALSMSSGQTVISYASGAGAVTSGTLSLSGGAFYGSNGSGTASVGVSGLTTISGTATVWGASATATAGCTFNLAGNMNMTAGSFYLSGGSSSAGTPSAGSGTLNMTGTSATCTISGGTFTFTNNYGNGYFNMTGSSSSFVQSGGTVRFNNAWGGYGINGIMTLAGSFSAPGTGTLDLNTWSTSNDGGKINVAGAFTMTGSGTITTSIGAGLSNGWFNFTGSSQTITASAFSGTISGASFYVNNNANVTLSTALSIVNTGSILDSFVVNSGGTLNCGTSIMTGPTYGYFINNGTLILGDPSGITSGTGTGATAGNIRVSGSRTFNGTASCNYTYSASGTQATGNGLPSSLGGTLKIANASSSAVVTLTNAVSIANTGGLNLNQGILTIGNNSLTNNGTLTGGSSSSYILTGSAGGTGSYIAPTSTSASTLLPIGAYDRAVASYTPLTIGNTPSGVVTLTSSVLGGTLNIPGSPLGACIVDLAWNVTASPATTANVTFGWNTANDSSSFSPTSSCDLGIWSGSSYTVLGTGLGVPTGSYTAMGTSVSIPTTTNKWVIGNLNCIIPGPTHYVITSQPTTGTTGVAVSNIIVQAQTAANALATSYTGPVTLTWVSGNSASNMTGTLTVNAVGGVATFSNVGFSLAGTYVVQATGSLTTSANSSNIVITTLGSTNVYGGDGVNWVGQNEPTPYQEPINCTYGDYRVLSYRRVATTMSASPIPTDGRGQWYNTIYSASSGGDVSNSNLGGGTSNGFIFTSGGACGNTGTFNNKWNFSGTGSAAVDAVNGMQWTSSGTGNDMGLDMSTQGYYTFVFKDAGYTSTGFYVGRTSSPPVTFIPSTNAVSYCSSSGTVITESLSAAPSSENVYIRYQINGTTGFTAGLSAFNQTTIAQGTVVGSTVTFTIPSTTLNTSSGPIYYYLFTSTESLATLQAANEGDKAYSLINYDDHSSSLYSYSVPSNNGTYIWAGGTSGSWTNPASWTPSGGAAAGTYPVCNSYVVFQTGGNVSVSNVPSVNLAGLSVATSGTSVTLAPAAGSGATALSLTNTSNALSVAAGCTLTLNPNNASDVLTLSYTSGTANTASIAGTLNLTSGSASSYPVYNAANCVTTLSGTLNISDPNAQITGSSTTALVVTAAGNVNMNGLASAIPLATWTTGSPGATLTLAGTATAYTNLNQTFANFTVNMTSSFTGPVNCSGALTTINGNLTITKVGSTAQVFSLATTTTQTVTVGGNLSVGGGVLSLTTGSGSTTMNVGGTAIFSAGTHTLATSTGNATLSVTGATTFSGATVIGNVNTGTSTINLAGAVTLSSGNLVLTNPPTAVTTAGASVVNVTGASNTFTLSGGSLYLTNYSTPSSTSLASATFNMTGASATFTSSAGFVYMNYANLHNASSPWSTCVMNLNNYTQSGTGSFYYNVTSGNTSSGILNVAGDFSLSGTGLFSSASQPFGEVYFNGTTQNISSSISTVQNVSFTIKNGSTCTLANNFSISTGTYNDSMTVAVGGTLYCGTNTVTSSSTSNGRFYNYGTLGIGSTLGIVSTLTSATGNIQTKGVRFFDGIASTSNYIYNNSTQAQVTGSGLPTSIAGTLTISNSFGVTLSQSTATAGTLAFTAGVLTLGGKNLTNSGSFTGYGPGKYVQTNNTGQFIQYIGSPQIFYPIGNSSYDPLWLSNPAQAGNCAVICNDISNFTTTPYSLLTNSQKAITRSWSITPSTPANLVVKAQWNSTAEEVNPTTFAGGTNAYVGMYDGSQWINIPATRNGYGGTTPNITSGSGSGVLTANPTNPYIFTVGMDDVFKAPNDAGVTAIATSATCATISGTATVTVKNFGTSPISQVVVTGSGALATASNSGATFSASNTGGGTFPIPVGGSTNIILIGITYAGGSTPLTAATTLPNGLADGYTGNDSYTASVNANIALNGTYTVGTGGNYTTLTAAVAAYNGAAICGPVTFSLINTGATAYTTTSGETFPIVINANSGASATNTLTITPATGKTPTISTGTNTSAPSVLQLNGASYVTINGAAGNGAAGATQALTITNTNTATTGTAVVFISDDGVSVGSTSNIVENCIITGNSRTTTNYAVFMGDNNSGTNVPGIQEGTVANTGNTIAYNAISKASVGIFFYGLSGGESGNNIYNNTLSTLAQHGICDYNETGAGIYSNVITGMTSALSTNGAGIWISGASNTLNIYNNKINNLANTNPSNYSAIGIFLGSTSSTSSINVYNNYISNIYGTGGATGSGLSENPVGIDIYRGGGYNLYNNSVYIASPFTTTGSTSACLFVESGNTPTPSGIVLEDNIFDNAGGASPSGATYYAVYNASSSNPFSTIDYNDYVSGTAVGGNLGYMSSSTATNVNGTAPSMASVFGGNTHSLNTVPAFPNASTGDLSTTTIALRAGLKITSPAITADIVGTTRSTTIPTIGAFEVAPVANDAGVSAVTTTATCPTTSGTATVTITNYGSNNITSVKVTGTGVLATAANSGQTFSSGNTGGGTFPIAVGGSTTITLTGITYKGGLDTLIVATSLPNAVADGNSGNDGYTNVSAPIVIGLSGTYTIGSAVSNNFTTITQAVAAYNAAPICGPVTFSLTNTGATAYTTSGGESFPIIINTNTGASASNTLTIKPATGKTPTITGSSATALLELNGASYVIVDGANTVGGTTQDLTFNNSNSSGGGVTADIWIASSSTPVGSTNNIIKNCVLTGYSRTVMGAGICSGSNTGIYSYATAANSNNTIQNNLINSGQHGVSIFGYATAPYDQNWIVNGNNFGSATTTSALNFGAIDVYNASSFNITNDTILGVTAAAASGNIVRGIFISGAINGGNISGNMITGIVNTGSTSTGSSGILLAATTTTSSINVYNNYISNVVSPGSSSVGAYSNGQGIDINSGGGYNIYYNTISLSTPQTTGISSAILVESGVTTAASVNIKDNIFVNTETVGTRYAIYSGAAASVYGTIDYNDYYGASNVGYLGGAQPTLALWAAATTKDAHSANILPSFVSPTNLDLTNYNNFCLASGVAISGITTDIHGTTRVVPVMGADEFNYTFGSTTVAGAVCVGSGITVTVAAPASTLAAGTYTVRYDLSGANTATAATATMTYSTGTNSGTFTVPTATIPVAGSTTLTITGIKSGSTCTSVGASFAASYVPVTNVTADQVAITVTPTVGTPTAITVGSGTEPTCQLTNGTTTTTYATTATNNTGFNWSLSSASAGSINASTGVMTWANGFSGSVDIRVTASGCNGPSSQVTRTVTITPTVGTPTAITVGSGTEPTCQLTNGTTTTTYATTATNNTGFNWSLSGASAGSINASTGVMTWANGFSGSVDIRVTASGCNGPSSQVTRTVTITPTVGTPTAITVGSGTEPTCQLTNGTTTTTYATTATNNTGFNWSLSSASAGSINASTGVMTWANGFSGSVDIRVTASGCNGPSSQVTRTVTITPTVGTPTAITVGSGTEPTCQLTNGTTTTTYATTATNNTGFNWSLSSASAGSINASTGVMTWANGFSGSVDIRVTASGCNGPSSQVTRTVTINPSPTITLGTSPSVCAGTTSTSLPYTATTGSPDQYSINFDAAANTAGFADVAFTALPGSSISIAVPSSVAANTYNATITVKNSITGCGSSSSYAFTITILALPTPSVNNPSVCSGVTATLTATGGTSYSWSTGASSSSITTTSAGTYSVTATNLAGCTATASGTVTVNAPPHPTVNSPTICSGSTATLTATGGVSYAWSTGASTTSITTSTAGTYTVTATNSNGCTASASGTVTVIAAATAVANASGNASVFNNATYTLSGSASNYTSYSWSVTGGTGALSNTGTLTPTYTPSAGQTGTVTVTLTVNANTPCATPLISSMVLTITPPTTVTWVGNTTAWSLSSNWNPAVAPSSCTDVVVIPTTPAGGSWPVITSSAQVGSIEIQNGAQMTINSGQTLSVCGTWLGGSTSNASVLGTGAVVMTGTAAQSISGKTSFINLIINNTGGLTKVLGSVDIKTALTLQRGNFNNTGTVTLKSDASGTGYLDNFTYLSTAGTYTGNLTVERYLSGSVGYRDISSPVSSTVADWGADFPVVGQNNVYCWYAYNPYPTLQIYKESDNFVTSNFYGGFVSYTSSTLPLIPMQGYAAQINTLPMTINTTGTPNSGTQSINITRTASSTSSADGWNMIGNPYPSPVRWSAIKNANPGATDGSVYRFYASGQYSGNWATHNGVTGTNNATDLISSTQAFFVSASANSTIKINDTVRSAGNPLFFKTNSALPDEIRINLANSMTADEVVAYTDPNATYGYDPGYDATKFTGLNIIHLGFDMPAKELAINVLDSVTEYTELPLRMVVTDTGTYTLTATELNLTDLTAYFKDAQTNRLTDLSLTAPTLYLDGGQDYTGRYSIIFRRKLVTGIGAVEDPSIRIYASGNSVYVDRSSSSQATIDITNELGQSIIDMQTNQEKTHILLPGHEEFWYAFVRVTEGSKVTVKKVLISNR